MKKAKNKPQEDNIHNKKPLRQKKEKNEKPHPKA